VRSLLPSHAIEPSPTSDVVRLRAAIASGASVLGAFERVGAGDGPWSASARSLVATAHAGLPLAAALRRWSAGGEERALVADALLIAGSTGGSQVRALDAAAATLAERRALQREIRALAAQASASAAVLVAAPVAFALGVALLDDRVRRFYTGSLAGLGCVIAGALLDAAGGWWMVRLVRSVR
jgi:tight adherence protein B